MPLDTQVQVHEPPWCCCLHKMVEWLNERSLSSKCRTELVALAVPHMQIQLLHLLCICARVHSVVLCTLQSDSWTQGHSVVKKWFLCGRSPLSISQLLERVPGKSIRPIHNHVPSTYRVYEYSAMPWPSLHFPHSSPFRFSSPHMTSLSKDTLLGKWI